MESPTSSDSIRILNELRSRPDAAQCIAEHLRTKEMGPADHIRTKHEIKAYLATGDAAQAEALVQRSAERLTQSISATVRQNQSQKQSSSHEL